MGLVPKRYLLVSSSTPDDRVREAPADPGEPGGQQPRGKRHEPDS